MPQKGQQHSIDKSRQLQCKLYLAAKKDKQRRFHALYDRIFRLDILWRAWKEVKENKGSAGIDGVTFEMIEEYGVESYLLDIQEDLMKGVYHPKPVKRVYIPKPDGKRRPLGIPVIRDRIVQQACKIVVEPVFEANFLECSYGFRPKRDAIQATKKVQRILYKNWYVVDADIKGYFDNIDHKILMSLIERRISDRRVLKLFRQWLKAGVIEDGKYFPTEMGSPQGGVISPLMANIYLHVLDSYWNNNKELGELVRYADDAVIICYSKKQADLAFMHLKYLMQRLKLTLHPVKTRIVDMNTESFDFLGFTFQKFHNKKLNRKLPYYNYRKHRKADYYARREKILSKIADIYHKHHGVDGYHSMQVYLASEGFVYSTTTVHKYMNSLLRLKSIVRPKKPKYEHGKPHKVFENKI